MRVFKYKVPKVGQKVSLCSKCKEQFEDGDMILEMDYNKRLCVDCGSNVINGQIEEYNLLLNQLKGKEF